MGPGDHLHKALPVVALLDKDNITQHQVAIILGRTDAAVSALLATLVKSGHVITYVSADYKRKNVVVLTSDGEALARKVSIYLNDRFSGSELLTIIAECYHELMIESLSERRMAENEVVFRKYNERIKNGFDELKRVAAEHDQEEMVSEDDTPLHFYCECSDEDCRKRVKLKPSRYDEIHEHRNRFVIICGHEMKDIEHIISKDTEFCIVEKFMKPPESATTLNTTDANNT